ncbi:hypothetical protein K2X85_16200 [bacterium]|nr:hypothetical protein [bacterium]
MQDLSGQVGISLTQFVNFATKPPEQQLTEARRIKQQHMEGYDVPPDMYKQFRDAVVRMHKQRRDKSYLDEVVARQTESSRVKHYPTLASGYKKFLGRKDVEWFDPPSGVWIFEDLRIKITPELGLVINGRPTVIKLYLNDSQTLIKRRAEIIIHLMKLGIPTLAEDDEVDACVLDVRKGQLFMAGKSDREQSILLRAQARNFVSMYREL